MKKNNAGKSSVIFFIILIAVIGYLFVGTDMFSSGPKNGEYEEGVLRVWVTWGDDWKLLQPLFDSYTKATGIPVKVATGVRANDLEQALASETPPDVIILSNNALVSTYYGQGLIEPLNDWITSTPIQLDDYYPGPISQCATPDEAIPCLSWIGDTYALYWNKDLFAAAGLDPERPPQTMEELLEYAALLTIRDGEGFSQVGFIPDYPRPHTAVYTHMFGGSWQNDTGNALNANSQAVIDAMDWQMAFYEQLGIPEANKFITSINRYTNSMHPTLGGGRLNCQQCHRFEPRGGDKIPDQGFYNGQVAMMVDGPWQLGANYIAQYNPGMNYGVAAFPPPTDNPGNENVSFFEGPVVIIPAGAADKQASANLIAWIMSPAVMADAALATSSLPATRTAAMDPRFQEIPGYQVFLDLLKAPYTIGFASTPISQEFNLALAEVEDSLLHAEDGNPALMLDALQAEYAPMLDSTLRGQAEE